MQVKIPSVPDVAAQHTEVLVHAGIADRLFFNPDLGPEEMQSLIARYTFWVMHMHHPYFQGESVIIFAVKDGDLSNCQMALLRTGDIEWEPAQGPAYTANEREMLYDLAC